MRTYHIMALSLVLLPLGYACAQVGVEAGLTGAGNAGIVDALRGLGSAVSRSVSGSTGAITAAAPVPGLTSSFSLAPGAPAASRSFVPQTAGQYVAGIAWRSPGDATVVLKAGAQEVTGTTAGPLLLHFEATAGSLCTVGVRATGQAPTTGLAGDVEFVRDVQPGEPPSKSLLSPDQRLAQCTRRGPRPSVLPLLVNLADRHLRSAGPATDLDGVLDRALAATPGVGPADLQTLVRDYDALPDAVKVQCFTTRALALRTLPAPTLADASALVSQPVFRAGSGYGGATAAAPPRITSLEPAVPAGGAYAPGATIRLLGAGFAPQPERDRVVLYPEVAGAFATRLLPVAAATPNSLQFQLPADLPDGGLRLQVTVDDKNVSLSCPLRVSTSGVSTPPGEPTAAIAGHYRLSCARLECVDATNPEWWGKDDVVLLLTAVGDGQVVTRAGGPVHDFSDGVAQPFAEGDRTVFAGVAVGEGMGVAAELWRWNPPAPTSGLAPWALRESFANALAAPAPRFGEPRGQNDVSAELAVVADLIGQQQAVWTAAELQQLLQPGQKLEKILDLRQGESPTAYDRSGYYRLTLEVERLD